MTSQEMHDNQMAVLQAIAASTEKIAATLKVYRSTTLPEFSAEGDPIEWHFTQADLERRDKRQQRWAVNECIAVIKCYCMTAGKHFSTQQELLRAIKERFNL